MKKTLFILLSLLFLLGSCANDKTFEFGTFGDENYTIIHAEPYGWMNKEENKIENIDYDLCIGNIVWSVLLAETIVAPILFTGLALYEPINYIGDPRINKK